jgi:predicted Zn-dependent protease
MSPPLTPKPAWPDFDIHRALSRLRLEADWVALRHVRESSYHRSVRNGKPDSNRTSHDEGVMIETRIDGQIGYAATCDLSEAGLLHALKRAVALAGVTARFPVCALPEQVRPTTRGQYASPVGQPFDQMTLAGFTDHLLEACRRLTVTDAVINSVAEATLTEMLQHHVSSSGADLHQQFSLISHHCGVTARAQGDIQQRSLNGPVARCVQGGLDQIDWESLYADCEQAGAEVMALLAADNCPDTTLDLILAPDQMLLQIHESIGHPLELDRILGDERNYAGWSFVQPGDFGRLQYGSALMNVTFDPGLSHQFAAYGFDDCGQSARREYLIRDGLLVRGLGSLESQHRLGVAGVANFRASGWNRAPIDRMANINLEPGSSSLEAMIAATERGIYLQSNRSWSIDDYRNKFQFGCEYARLIEDGRLTRVVKNPNYRGITVPFWHSLKAVGNADERQVFGTPYCGKGEPNQMIRVGHAAPPCLFSQVAVFGGHA